MDWYSLKPESLVMKVFFFLWMDSPWSAHDYMHLICVKVIYSQLEVNELLWCCLGIFFWFISTKKATSKEYRIIHEWEMKLLNWEMWEVLPRVQHILTSGCCLTVITHNNKIPHRCRYGIFAFRAILIFGPNIVPNRPNHQMQQYQQSLKKFVVMLVV